MAVPTPVEDQPSRAMTVALPQQLQRFARSAQRWRAGCTVTVLRDGTATYPAMLEAIRNAKKYIHLETYILAADRTGDTFKLALVERARAGVHVRLLYDAVGSFGLPTSWVNDLRAAGCEVIDFNPIAPWRARFNLSHRDHRKTLIVDDEVAFTGGLNIANDYASVADGGVGWHDMHCRVTGPIVYDVARGFRRTWLRSGGTAFPPPARGASKSDGSSFVRLIENSQRRQRTAIRRAYIHVIKAARESLYIHNAYFLPDRGLRRALVRAARRGVDVQIVVPGHSDVRVIEWASLYVMRRLAKRGCKILRWRGPMMHAKTAVVDETWCTIGSYNFDAQSRFNNLELCVEILDPTVSKVLVAEFHHDLANCDAYDEQVWQRSPWWRKAFAWLAFRLRRFL